LNHLKIYSDYLDKINEIAYNDVSLLSNVTLSKNPYTGSEFLKNIIQGGKNKLNKYMFIKNCLIFFIKNTIYFSLWLIYFFYSKIFFNKKINFNNNKIILIDTYFTYNQINKSHKLNDNYFSQFYNFLDKNQLDYIIIPKISDTEKSPIKMLQLLKYLSKLKQKNITEFDILSFYDIYQIFFFIIKYPFKIQNMIKSIKIKSNNDDLFIYDLVYTLKNTVFFSHVRYLLGRKLKLKLLNNNVKLISWCEYQTIDKNFYKGIKNFNTHIYGCQFLIKYPTLTSCYIPEVDKKHGITPDTILVNGKYYLPKNSSYIYKIGPPFRYKNIIEFDRTQINNINTKLLVMLPYVQSDAFNIINILKESDFFSSSKIDFKIHPDYTSNESLYKKLMSSNWKIIKEIERINNYGFLISSGSGTLMEFAAIGLSVIIIKSKLSFTTNPMPEYGKKTIWDIAGDKTSLEEKYKNLLENRKNNFSKIKAISSFYLESFFSSINDDKILKNFDLQKWIN